MRKIVTQSSARSYRDLKGKPQTTRQATNRRLPVRTAEHIRHAHSLKGIREIARVGWQEWEPIVAEALRSLERQRYDKANRYYHAVQRIEVLLAAVRRRGQELEATARELEETGTYLQVLMDAMLDAVWTIDPGGRVTDVNPATERLTGLVEAQLVGRPFVSFFSDAARVSAILDMVLGGTPSFNVELELRSRRRGPIPVSFSATALHDADGAVTGVVGNARDITELAKAQALLRRQTEELQRSNAELEQFAYVASHDLREPLRKIQTFADRLGGAIEDRLGERERDYLVRMHDAADRMQTLITDLLSLSRITTQAQPFVDVDLNEVMVGVLQDLEVAVEASGGRVEVGDLPRLQADPTQMRQLLQNLVSNSLKFCRSGVPLLVRVQAEPTQIDGRKAWSVRVEDNGIGFDQSFAERIFTVFQRLHGRGTYEGTGIGLTICRKIAERHGGKITATAQADGGATFTVVLPAKVLVEGAVREGG